MTTSTSIIREDAEQIVSDLGGALDPLLGATLLVTGASGFLCSHFLETIAVFNESARRGWAGFLTEPDFRKAVAESDVGGKAVVKVDSVFVSPTDFSPLK